MTLTLPVRVPNAARHRIAARYVYEEHGRALCGECGRGLHRVTSALVSWRRWWRHDPRRRQPELIAALEQNQMVLMLCWVSSRRGGHHVYEEFVPAKAEEGR